MKNSKPNVLMIAASELDANLYYATRFIAPDAFVYMQIKGKKHLLMNDLEVDRAKDQADVNQVHSISKLAKAYVTKHNKRPGYLDLIADFAKSKGARSFIVPDTFPLGYADTFRKMGLKLKSKSDPFFEERTIKAPYEVKAIEKAIRHVEDAVDLAIKALKKSVIKKGKLYYHGERLTSEAIKKIINVKLMENDCIANHSIVACGKHAVDPHNEGSGQLYANQTIIMDIFPRDSKSRYHADFTRTVVRGKASKKVKEMYQAVWEGQEIGFKMIKPGVDASTVHTAIHKRFEALGFKTGLIKGRMQGFFHGTGHGLGLDIHEQPSVGMRKDILQPGHVVTVEPGLYYQGLGGIRLEDVVVVTKTGCRNLTKYPKFLEI